MSFSFDTNIFINLKRKYPKKTNYNGWKKIESLLHSGEILVSREVVEEIKNGTDDLDKWLLKHTKNIIETDQEISKYVYQIMNTYQGWIDVNSTINRADPYVIAVAKKFNATVVTNEGKAEINGFHKKLEHMMNQIKSAKINAICFHENVPCINLVQFLLQLF